MDEQTWNGITEVAAIEANREATSLRTSTKGLFPAQILALLCDKIIASNTSSFISIRDRLMSLFNFTQDESLNQMRFSLLTNITGFVDAYGIFLHENQLSMEAPVNTTWRAIYDDIRAIANDGNNPRLFTYKQDAEFATILSVHCNAKEYNPDSYNDTIAKRMKAYYNQQGYPYIGTDASHFLRYLYAADNVKNYHDFIRTDIRKIIYECVKESQDSCKNYLYGTLMEWNSMSLIRETFRIITEDIPRNFLTDQRYVQQIRTFMTWWNNHNSGERADEFPYSWYHNPGILEEVTHAKLSRLYSLVLKVCKLNQMMAHYKAPSLAPGSITEHEIAENHNLIYHSGDDNLDQAYYGLIRRRQAPVQNLNLDQNFIQVFARQLAGLGNQGSVEM